MRDSMNFGLMCALHSIMIRQVSIYDKVGNFLSSCEACPTYVSSFQGFDHVNMMNGSIFTLVTRSR